MTRDRLPWALGTAVLSEVELRAARLDGEIAACGPAWVIADAVEGTVHRAAALASVLGPRFIAERRTAAWVHGALLVLPDPLELCTSIRARAMNSARALPLAAHVREVVIDEHEITRVAGLGVTTPERTLADVARFTARDDEAIETVRALAAACALDIAACRRDLASRTSVSWKRRALARLDAVSSS